MGPRRKARECGLQVLYLLETQGRQIPPPGQPLAQVSTNPLQEVSAERVEEALNDFFEHFDAPDRTHTYTAEIVQGVVTSLDKIDEVLTQSSPRWRVSRMAVVDRNVLRIAAYELLQENGPPPRAVLDEAVEVARRYGSEKSSAFVNGVLDTLIRQIRPAAAKERDE